VVYADLLGTRVGPFYRCRHRLRRAGGRVRAQALMATLQERVADVLLRAAPDSDLWAVYTTVAEGFGPVGSEAELRARTEFSPAAWERARATGSSAARGDYGFDDEDCGLIVQDATPVGQRWLPRAQLADYLRALLADDRERLFQLSQAFADDPAPAILERYPVGSPILVRPDRSPDAPWVRGQVRAGLDAGTLPDGASFGRLLVRLSSTGESRWFGAQWLRDRYYVTTQPDVNVRIAQQQQRYHGHWEAGEIGVVVPQYGGADEYEPSDDEPADAVTLCFGGFPIDAESPYLARLQAAIDGPDETFQTRLYVVPLDKVREIDPASVRAERDEQGRVLRYVAAPAAGDRGEVAETLFLLHKAQNRENAGKEGGLRPSSDAEAVARRREERWQRLADHGGSPSQPPPGGGRPAGGRRL
jgi:hypothetical protein